MKPVSAGILKNGFRFYTLSDPYLHLAGVGVKVGGLYDPSDVRGMAHLAEHIASRETARHKGRDIELLLRKYGCGPRANINIRTDQTSTFYGTDLLLRRKFMTDLFDMFADMVTKPVVRPAGLAIEKAAMYNEFLHHGEDDAEDLVSRLVHQSVYERNPARNRFDCESDELKAVSVKRVQKFIDSYYVPNNMFAVVLGPEYLKVKEMAERYFGDLPSKALPPFPHDISEARPVISGIKRAEFESKKTSVHHVALAFPTNPWGHDDDEAIEVLSEVLMFRVEQALRERNHTWGSGTYHPFVWLSRSFVHGFLYVWFETPSADFVNVGIDRVLKECAEIQKGGVLEERVEAFVKNIADPDIRDARALKIRRERRVIFAEDVQAMKSQFHYNYLDEFRQTVGSLSERIIEHATNGDEEMTGLNSYLSRLNAVTRKRVIAVANEYLNIEHHAQVVIKPAA